MYWWLGDNPSSTHGLQVCGRYDGMMTCHNHWAYSVTDKLAFESFLHVKGGDTLSVDISSGGTPPVVTTDFDYLYLTT